MKKYRIAILQIALLLIVSIICVTVAVREKSQTVVVGAAAFKTVILDAGHGGLTNTIH